MKFQCWFDGPSEPPNHCVQHSGNTGLETGTGLLQAQMSLCTPCLFTALWVLGTHRSGEQNKSSPWQLFSMESIRVLVSHISLYRVDFVYFSIGARWANLSFFPFYLPSYKTLLRQAAGRHHQCTDYLLPVRVQVTSHQGTPWHVPMKTTWGEIMSQKLTMQKEIFLIHSKALTYTSE